MEISFYLFILFLQKKKEEEIPAWHPEKKHNKKHRNKQ